MSFRIYPAFVSALVISTALLVSADDAAIPPPARGFQVEKLDDAVALKAPGGNEVLRYQTKKPSDSKLSVESAGYFHPLATPSGVVLTDVAPGDHLHHRGIFLGWVEMRGQKAADFWGWGEKAPKTGRRIVNTGVRNLAAHAAGAKFQAQNEWIADGETILSEDLNANLQLTDGAHVLDLTYTLKSTAKLTLEQWAFSGFCVRGRQDGEVEAEDPKGPARYLDPRHTDPGTDWPSARWYAFNYQLTEGKVASLAVIDHPLNPPSLWHNHRGLRMLNPCIVAPGRVVLQPSKPLVLRYRVVAADGRAPKTLLNTLAQDWAAAK